MDLQRQNFLMAVLGTDGATMLVKAVEKHPVLEHALVPRTILAWLQSAPCYDGALPGGESHVAFEKAESGFVGSVAMGEETYKFESVSLFHVAGAVAVALGIEQMDSEGLRDLDIERLGKSIDALAKVKRVNDELTKNLPESGSMGSCPTCGGRSADAGANLSGLKHGQSTSCSDCGTSYKIKGSTLPKPPVTKEEEPMDKTAGTGVPAAPTAPTPPAAPSAAAPKAAKPALMPKTPKPQTMALTRSEVEHKCPACGGTQFKDGKFAGCICFRAMNKAIAVVSSNGDGLTIELDMRILDADDVATFREALGR